MPVELAWSAIGIACGPMVTMSIAEEGHGRGATYRLTDLTVNRNLRGKFTVSMVAATGLAILDHRIADASLLAASSWLAITGTQLMMIDWAYHRLPNHLVTATLLGGVAIFSLTAVREDQVTPLLRALTAAAVLFTGGLVAALIAPGSLGAGDVKLLGAVAPYLGWIGWPHVLRGVVLALALAAVVGAVLLATRRISWGDRFAFGPAIVGGALLTLVTS